MKSTTITTDGYTAFTFVPENAAELRQLLSLHTDGEDADGDVEPYEDGYTDVEADADTLASAGWGTDEDYGCFGGGEDY